MSFLGMDNPSKEIYRFCVDQRLPLDGYSFARKLTLICRAASERLILQIYILPGLKTLVPFKSHLPNGQGCRPTGRAAPT